MIAFFAVHRDPGGKIGKSVEFPVNCFSAFFYDEIVAGDTQGEEAVQHFFQFFKVHDTFDSLSCVVEVILPRLTEIFLREITYLVLYGKSRGISVFVQYISYCTASPA